MKKGIIIFGVGIAIAASIVYYLFNMPKRDVQNTEVDFKISATNLVNEYLTDAAPGCDGGR